MGRGAIPILTLSELPWDRKLYDYISGVLAKYSRGLKSPKPSSNSHPRHVRIVCNKLPFTTDIIRNLSCVKSLVPHTHV